ncbi:MAG TPA: FHA domain-containing protein, partial [Pseudonocardiaceae bacterium]|nr:FHA domain-containing protein [Pseudonocardiaceae bacterium]
PDADEHAAHGDLVLGVYCRRSHFNDPAMTYCTVCGISMAQSVRSRTWGRRPSLGVLVLDDGGMFSLVREHVFGREPEIDPAVVAGRAIPVTLADRSVSRVHARIVLNGWDVHVVDTGSTNGTFVSMPGASSWTPIPHGSGAALRPGMVVAFGSRQLRYYSHRAQSVDFASLEPLQARG